MHLSPSIHITIILTFISGHGFLAINSQSANCFRMKDIYVLTGGISPHIDLHVFRHQDKWSTIIFDSSVFGTWLQTLKQPYIKLFPVDPNSMNKIQNVRRVIFSSVSPAPFKSKISLVAISQSAIYELLDVDFNVLSSHLFLNFVSGNHFDELKRLLPNPLAHRYGGHQFGFWAGQLGDGRAHLIGVKTNKKNERWEIQLKGSGQTPYSRRGDGRAVLRSSVREFLASEAIYHLGVPTSRAASLIVTDDLFARDQFYDGNVIFERGAVVMRLAPSWFRFGSLEILTKSDEFDLLQSLTDFVIDEHFPQIDSSSPDKYLMFFQEIVISTAHMIALWQSIGFVHGVMNTDNFSLLSITIDYGPFGFMDTYDPKFIPNTSDDEARYSYKNQPRVGSYNLDKLKQALWPLWDPSQRQTAEIIFRGYNDQFRRKYISLFSQKLGLQNTNDLDSNVKLIDLFLQIIQESSSDFTLTFRHLGEVSLEDLKGRNFNEKQWTLKIIEKHSLYENFLELYQRRLSEEGTDDGQRQSVMSKVNPRYILRNWMAERVIAQAENNDFSGVKLLLNILESPYTVQKEAEDLRYADKPPYWASHIKISCSS